jgi:hypothetical protein
MSVEILFLDTVRTESGNLSRVRAWIALYLIPSPRAIRELAQFSALIARRLESVRH